MANDTKAFFVDLDGTFLDDAKQIPEENRLAVNELLKRGHKTIITTGRPLPSAIRQAVKLGLTGQGCYLIAYNGGVLYDLYENKTIYEKTVPLSFVKPIFDEANRRRIHIQAYDHEAVLVEPRCDNDIVSYYCTRIEMPWHVIPSVSGLTEEPAKLLIIDRTGRESLCAMKDWIRERFDADLDTFFSSIEFLEVVAKNLNKGNGLIQMADLLHIDIRNTVALGDEENDISMIRTAGIGCAMANGTKDARAAADYVTKLDNNHGGAAEVIQKFILN